MSRQQQSPGLFDGDEGSQGSPKRGSVNKQKAAKQFRGQSTRTKAINVAAAPMRGGWRL